MIIINIHTICLIIMSNLADISYQTIEDSIMKVLICNEGSYFAYNKLYSQVLNVLDLNTTFVDRTFKFKFMLVLKTFTKVKKIIVWLRIDFICKIYNLNRRTTPNYNFF